MKRFHTAAAALLLLATAALVLGGCGHYGRGCGMGRNHVSGTVVDTSRHGPGCGHPYTP